MTEYVHVGPHADMLASGRVVAPGERVSPDDLDLDRDDGSPGEDRHIVDEGRLIDTESFGEGEDNKQTRTELRKRAADLGLEGWSSMKVDELRAAIAAHEAQEGVSHAA